MAGEGRRGPRCEKQLRFWRKRLGVGGGRGGREEGAHSRAHSRVHSRAHKSAHRKIKQKDDQKRLCSLATLFWPCYGDWPPRS